MGLVAVAALCLLTTSAIAQSPVGSWKGKINMKMPTLPANMPPSSKAMVQQQLAAVQKMVINLTMKKDQTYTVTTTGAPAGAGNQDDKGTWKQKGKTITMSSGKKTPNGANKPQDFILSADGKTLTLTIPGPSGANSGSIVFKKA